MFLKGESKGRKKRREGGEGENEQREECKMQTQGSRQKACRMVIMVTHISQTWGVPRMTLLMSLGPEQDI